MIYVCDEETQEPSPHTDYNVDEEADRNHRIARLEKIIADVKAEVERHCLRHKLQPTESQTQSQSLLPNSCKKPCVQPEQDDGTQSESPSIISGYRPPTPSKFTHHCRLFSKVGVQAAAGETCMGDRLLPCFDSLSDINLQSSKAHAPRWGPDSSTSEVSTIQLEFRDLSRATIDMSKCPEVLSWTEYVKKMPRTGEVVAEERHDHDITRNTVLRK